MREKYKLWGRSDIVVNNFNAFLFDRI
jgi:hypothetical protein